MQPCAFMPSPANAHAIEGAAGVAHGERIASRRGHRLYHFPIPSASRIRRDARSANSFTSRFIFRARTSRRATSNIRATTNSLARRWRYSSRTKRRTARRNGPTSAAICRGGCPHQRLALPARAARRLYVL
jgi:hypothetical protein